MGGNEKESAMSETARITQQEVQSLPRWARLAFAARCLRRAQGLLQSPGEPFDVLGSALQHIDGAARTAAEHDDLAEAAASAYTLALDRLDGPEPTSTTENDTIVTCMVAHATAFAAEAATLSDGRLAAHLVAQSVDFAIHAFRVARSASAPEAIAGMRADLHQLTEAVDREGWDDQTPVGQERFGPL
jgi:hypothetical protein